MIALQSYVSILDPEPDPDSYRDYWDYREDNRNRVLWKPMLIMKNLLRNVSL